MLAVVAAACGSAKESPGPPADRTTVARPVRSPSPAMPSAAVAPSARDLSRFVLTAGPETAGLTQMEVPGSATMATTSGLAGEIRVFLDCLGLRSAPSGPAYIGPYFTGPGNDTGTIVSSTSALLPPGAMETELAAFRSPKYPGCFGTYLAHSLLAGVVRANGAGRPSADVLSARAMPAPPGATTRVDTVVSLTLPTGTRDVHIAAVIVLDRRVESTVDVVTSNGRPPDPARIDLLTSQVVRKVRAQ
jgi:hypothetical protein